MRKMAICMTAILVAASGVALAQAPAHTVWDGVFSAAQATTGKQVYADKCATCHGDALNGAEMAPPLAGAEFLGNWSGQAVGDLANRIQTTMPASDPGSLSPQQVADVTAYILSANQFPAAAAALPADPAAQGQINIAATKPVGK